MLPAAPVTVVVAGKAAWMEAVSTSIELTASRRWVDEPDRDERRRSVVDGRAGRCDKGTLPGSILLSGRWHGR